MTRKVGVGEQVFIAVCPSKMVGVHNHNCGSENCGSCAGLQANKLTSAGIPDVCSKPLQKFTLLILTIPTNGWSRSLYVDDTEDLSATNPSAKFSQQSPHSYWV